MTDIRYAESADRALWLEMDEHLSPREFERKARDGMCCMLLEDGLAAGVLRYGLFWDSIPFLNLLFVRETHQRRGYGTALMRFWEEDMTRRGYGMVMTSTQVDESAQHFYRKLGYRDAGGLLLDIPGYEQPMELFMTKALARK